MDKHEMNWEQELLSSSAAVFQYPSTPNLRAPVLLQTDTPQTRSTPGLRRLSYAAAVAAVGVAALAVIAPAPREAIADLLGLRVAGEVIERLSAGIDELPEAVPIFELATVTDLENAAELAGFEPLLVSGQGEPQSVLVLDYDGESFVVLVYEKFELWQSDGGGYFGKELPDGTKLLDVSVNGFPAYWIRGGPHLVTFYGEDGEPVVGSVRTVLGNTLLLNTDERFYRLETELGLEQAKEIAASLP